MTPATPSSSPATTHSPGVVAGSPSVLGATPPISPASPVTVSSNAFDGDAIHQDRLQNRGDYLANPDVVNHVRWGEDEEVSNGDILKWSDTGDPALVCAIGQIVPDRLKTGTLGNHDKKFGKPISDAKIQFTIAACLSNPALQGAWDTTTAVLQQIQRMGASTTIHNHLLTAHRGRTGIRLAIPVFTGRTDVYDANGKDPLLSYSVPAEYKRDVADIVEHFRLNDMRFYDIDGSLIHPTVFSTRLPGAVVEVWFTLQHYLFSKNGERASDTFTAKLFQLRILRPNSRGTGSPFATRNPSLGLYIPPNSPSRTSGGQVNGVAPLGRVLSFGSGTENSGLQGTPETPTPGATAAQIDPAAIQRLAVASQGDPAANATPPVATPQNVPAPSQSTALHSDGIATPPDGAPAPAVEAPAALPYEDNNAPAAAVPACSQNAPEPGQVVTAAAQDATPTAVSVVTARDQPVPEHTQIVLAQVQPDPATNQSTAATGGAPSTVTQSGFVPASLLVVSGQPNVASPTSAGDLAPPAHIVEGAGEGSSGKRRGESGPSTRAKRVRLTLNGSDA